jgi:hypothetical protein
MKYKVTLRVNLISAGNFGVFTQLNQIILFEDSSERVCTSWQELIHILACNVSSDVVEALPP